MQKEVEEEISRILGAMKAETNISAQDLHILATAVQILTNTLIALHDNVIGR